MLVLVCAMSLTSAAQYEVGELDLSGDLESWYDELVGLENTPLVHGVFYKIEINSPDTDPFFVSANWDFGKVNYRGQTYKDVLLLYNTQSDIVLVKHPSFTNQPIKLFQDQVAWFELAGKRFEAMREVELPMRPGYYEIFYEGDKISMIVKRRKTETLESSKVVYKEEDRYFLEMEGKTIRYNGRRSFRKLGDEYKSVFKPAIKEYGLTWRAAKDDQDLRYFLEFVDEKMRQ